MYLLDLLLKNRIGLFYNIDTTTQDDIDRGGTFLELNILETKITRQNDLAIIPLEGSKDITDNIIIQPISIIMQVIISNNSSYSILGGLSAFNKYERNTKLQKGLTLLEKIQTQCLLCDIFIDSLRKNMILKSLSYKLDENNFRQYVIADMEFSEIPLYDVLKKNKKDRKRIILK